MTISSTTARNNYVGNNSTAVYAYGFKIFASSELLVTKQDLSGNLTPLALSTDYTVSGVGSQSGGNVTLVAGNLPTGYALTIRRNRALTQATDIRNQGTFYPEAYEDALDALVMNDQQIQEQLSRAVVLPETVDPSSFNPALPSNIAQASVALGTDATGTKMAMGPSFGAISSAAGYAASAAAALAALNSVMLSVKNFGAKGDGTTDDTTAIRAAITYALANGNPGLFWPAGTYIITGTLVNGGGLQHTGVSPMTATVGLGTTIIHNYNGDLFRFDGSVSNTGGGGGIRDMNLFKGDGYTTGSAIYLYAASTSVRAIDMVFENVFINISNATGLWTCGIRIDGSNASTPGSVGVRDIHFKNVRVTNVSTAGKSVWITQGTHIDGELILSQGNGGDTGVTIDGYWDDIQLWNLSTCTSLNVSHTATPGTYWPQLTVTGHVQNFTNTYSGLVGNALLSNPGSTGTVVSNNAPNFFVISNGFIWRTGKLSLPDTTDTLVGRATADTLTNKTVADQLAMTLGSGGNAVAYLPPDDYSVAQTIGNVFTPIYNSSGTHTQVAGIKFSRTSTTDGSYDGKVALQTRATGGSLTDSLTVDKNGNVVALGTLTGTGATLSGLSTAGVVTNTSGGVLGTVPIGAANGVASLDSNGLVPVNQMPPAALERLVIVANQTARFALTTATVQNGDTISQTDTGLMYYVIDQTNLGNSAGYQVYTAGTAAAVAWSGVTGIPSPVSSLTGTNSGDVTLVTPNGLSLAGQVLSLGVASAGVTGALSGTDWSTFNNKAPTASPTFTGQTTSTNPLCKTDGSNIAATFQYSAGGTYATWNWITTASSIALKNNALSLYNIYSDNAGVTSFGAATQDVARVEIYGAASKATLVVQNNATTPGNLITGFASDGTTVLAKIDNAGKFSGPGANFSGLTVSQAVFTDGSGNLVSNAITGTGNVVLSANPTFTGTITAAAITATGAYKYSSASNSTGFAARYNSTTLPIGFFIQGSSGGAFLAGNLIPAIAPNFNYDQTGFAYIVGDPGGNGKLNFYTFASGTGGTAAYSGTAAGQALQIDGNQNVAIGSAALATNATDGFLYIETCAGTPTGVPTAYTGRAPILYDTTNNKLWVYNGAWKGVVLS